MLIAVTKGIKHEEASPDMCPGISKDHGPVMQWADLGVTDTVTCIDFLAAFVPYSLTALVQQLQLLAEAPLTNIAASVNVVLAVAPTARPTPAMPMPPFLFALTSASNKARIRQR